jgi:hypothetical protein
MTEITALIIHAAMFAAGIIAISIVCGRMIKAQNKEVRRINARDN